MRANHVSSFTTPSSYFSRANLDTLPNSDDIDKLDVPVLRRDNDRRHDGRDGDDDEPQLGREEEGDEGAKDWRPGLIHNNHRLMIL